MTRDPVTPLEAGGRPATPPPASSGDTDATRLAVGRVVPLDPSPAGGRPGRNGLCRNGEPSGDPVPATVATRRLAGELARSARASAELARDRAPDLDHGMDPAWFDGWADCCEATAILLEHYAAGTTPPVEVAAVIPFPIGGRPR